MSGVADHGTTRADEARVGSATISRTVTAEAETYSRSVGGVDIEAVRAGPGIGPTEVLSVTTDRATFTAGKTGFPMFSRMTVPNDMVVIASIRSAPPGNRWCEIDLAPGAVLVEAPGCEHTSRSRPGLEFGFSIVDVESIQRLAERLEISIDVPMRGEAQLIAPTAESAEYGRLLWRFADDVVAGTYSSVLADDVIVGATRVLGVPDRPRRIGSTRRIDGRQVVRACIEYAVSIDQIPSISELCLAAHVSERRLRDAFGCEFDLPPTQYFRLWALDEAHRRLSRAATEESTVTEFATGLGFSHLGRFAGHYKRVYGVAPSTTLLRI